jgi:hypothetical protein
MVDEKAAHVLFIVEEEATALTTLVGTTTAKITTVA